MACAVVYSPRVNCKQKKNNWAPYILKIQSLPPPPQPNFLYATLSLVQNIDTTLLCTMLTCVHIVCVSAASKIHWGVWGKHNICCISLGGQDLTLGW